MREVVLGARKEMGMEDGLSNVQCVVSRENAIDNKSEEG
jgi:hypothetical protein